MIKHLVSFQFRAEASAADVQATLDALNALPGQIPWVRHWSLGRNFSTRDTTFSHALCCDFASEQELSDYLTHPAHERVVQEYLSRLWERRAIVDYVFEP